MELGQDAKRTYAPLTEQKHFTWIEWMYHIARLHCYYFNSGTLSTTPLPLLPSALTRNEARKIIPQTAMYSY